VTATVRSAQIAESITDNLAPGDLPQDVQELQALLVHAARLGKIEGLRKARKLARRGGAYLIAGSIKNTYAALGYDTDEYEAAQREAHPERYVTSYLLVGFDADEAQARVDAAQEEPQDPAFSNATIAGFAGMADVPVPRVLQDNPQA
jgi:hypothetical protein